MPTISSNSVSTSYAASFTDLVYPLFDSLVTGDTQASVYPNSSGRVTGYYAVSELIAVPDLESPVTEVNFLASWLTIIESTVVSSQFENMIRDDR